ncbi:hypothetical protein GDO81_025710 [Engystomops pustulosus]|uniref:Uncharacterized protein n=1 Tax=Engystomops pustulosus TaxID=76066 RepID=A0AAV6YM79_ENGPU|nr:hypothetical protein GDO81_025710 [Engystomops pustulosus]
MSKLTQLERLDLGNNEFSELPEGVEQIQNLKELWIDNNSLQTMSGSIGKLKQLIYLDMSKNRIESIDMEVSGCESLEDLLLSSNLLQHLPDSLGKGCACAHNGGHLLRARIAFFHSVTRIFPICDDFP